MQDPNVAAAEAALKANPKVPRPYASSINCSRFGPIEVSVMSGSADLTQVQVGPVRLSYSMFGRKFGLFVGDRGIRVEQPINEASGEGFLVGGYRLRWVDRVRTTKEDAGVAALERVLARWKVKSKADLAEKLERVEVIEKALKIDTSYRA